MRRGTVVHSAFPSAGERPRRLYLGFYEISGCRLRRMSSVVGIGASQLGRGFTSPGDGPSPSKVDECDPRVSCVI